MSAEIKFQEWLDEQVDHSPRYLGPPERVPRSTRLAYLFFCNGMSLGVRGWGVMSSHPNGHPSGLDQNEGIQLLFLSGIVEGFQRAGVDTYSMLMPVFDRYNTDCEKREEADRAAGQGVVTP